MNCHVYIECINVALEKDRHIKLSIDRYINLPNIKRPL